MYKILLLSSISLMLPAIVGARPILDQQQAESINQELMDAMRSKDVSIIRKYMFDGTEIIVDLDPDKDAGEKELTLEKYIDFTNRSIDKMGVSGVDVRLLAITLNEGRNQATIDVKVKVVTKNMGNNFQFVSTKQTILGVVDEEIKVISSKDHLISIEALD